MLETFDFKTTDDGTRHIPSSLRKDQLNAWTDKELNDVRGRIVPAKPIPKPVKVICRSNE